LKALLQEKKTAGEKASRSASVSPVNREGDQGVNAMGKANAFIFPCLGLSQDPRGLCSTQIGIITNEGPSVFICPACDTVYIVDPLNPGLPEARGGHTALGWSNFEANEHKVEVIHAERAERLRDNREEAEALFRKKVGSLDHVYVANAYSNEAGIVRHEVEAASREVQGFRPDKPLTHVEKGLGLMAFVFWLRVGKELSDETYFTAPNQSARTIAIRFAETYLANDAIKNAIRSSIPTFDPQQEVRWARELAIHAQWNTCVTRAIIMLCRVLAYRYTGVYQPYSAYLHSIDPDVMWDVALAMNSRT
jgi:hypothetical protein